jgi:hypothetical protein
VIRLWDDFLPEVLPFVQNCPELTASNAVKNACIEFCERSLWWLFEHDPIVTTALGSRYALVPPDGTLCARVMDAWHNDTSLSPRSDDQLRSLFGPDWRNATGSPRYITHITPDIVMVVPTPQEDAADGTLSLIIALRPTRESAGVDSIIYDRWLETVAAGARARLYDVAGQPFSDPTAAIKSRLAFNRGIAEAARDRARSMGRGISRVRPLAFF